MSKKCTRLWRKAHVEVKTHKTHQRRSTFGSWAVEKAHAVVARSTCRSQNVQSTPRSDHFWTFRGRHKGFCTFPKVSQTWSSSKNVGRRGTSEEDLQRCMSRGRRSTRDTWVRYVRRSGRWFPARGCILEQIFKFAKMILRDRCSTSYNLASLFRGRRNTLDRWNGKIAKRIGTRPLALHSSFHVWRKSRRIASFLMLTTPKIEGLADLLRFWSCQVQKLRASRRFFFCVFDVFKFRNWGSLAE